MKYFSLDDGVYLSRAFSFFYLISYLDRYSLVKHSLGLCISSTNRDDVVFTLVADIFVYGFVSNFASVFRKIKPISGLMVVNKQNCHYWGDSIPFNARGVRKQPSKHYSGNAAPIWPTFCLLHKWMKLSV
nr:uncharacterized protein LOC118680957 [Bactrocera oleae]